MKPVLTIEGLGKQFQLHEQQKLIPSCANVSLQVHTGRLTALVGPTGAGKSSVLKCIYRTYLPSAGRMLYNDAQGNAIDLAQASEHRMLDLRRHEISFVTQFLHCLPRSSALDVVCEPLVARGTEREAAHMLAKALLSLLNVPERLWGVPPATFSGGERQRISIARALLIDPRILILDEATSSVDTTTEKEIQKALDNLVRGRTTIAIAHRLSTLRDANRLIVLDRGSIVEVGNHDELMAQAGHYFNLYQAQARNVDTEDDLHRQDITLKMAEGRI